MNMEAQAIAAGFTQEEATQYINVFQKFDEDSSGAIDADEIKKLFDDLGEQISNQQIQDLITSVDRNNNRLIEFDEFLSVLQKYKNGEENKLAEAANKKNFFEQEIEKNKAQPGIKTETVWNPNKAGLQQVNRQVKKKKTYGAVTGTPPPKRNLSDLP